MRKIYMPLIPVLCLVQVLSCNSIRKGLPGNRPPHEAYGEALSTAGLRPTELGSQWFAAATAALQKPVGITIPYKETGFFAAEKPGAAGFSIPLRKGEIVKIAVTTIPLTGGKLFTELWQAQNNGFKLLSVEDTVTHTLLYECESNANYILRLQPELLKSIEYTLTVVTTPSLAFPVHESGKPKIISGWGVGRDNGTRSHEGIDIGAVFGTPVLAVSDGYISRVTENKLGGKVIFLNPENKNYSVYYAHLDKQIATAGQRIKAGDIIGQVGNTGNAKNTVPHLHFGIYATGGAVDPQPFVDPVRQTPAAITAGGSKAGKAARINAGGSLFFSPNNKAPAVTGLIKDQAAIVEAASGDWYRVSLPDGRSGYVRSGHITDKPVRKYTMKDSTRLLTQPLNGSPARRMLPAGTVLQVMARHADFYFVQGNELTGWIRAGVE